MNTVCGINILSVLEITCLANHRLEGYLQRLRRTRRAIDINRYDWCCSPPGPCCDAVDGPHPLTEAEVQQVRTLDFLIARCREEVTQRKNRPVVDKKFKGNSPFRRKNGNHQVHFGA